MSSIDTRIAEEALRNLSSAFIRNRRLAMKTATVIVQRQARAKHKFRSRSGAAEASIETEVTQTSEGTVGIVEVNPKKAKGAMHAIYQHEGTGLYGYKHQKFKISAKNKKSLRWVTAGGFAFAKSVMNPGIKADPYLYNALDACEARINDVFARYTERTIMESGLS
jgi:hypothetical protein